MPMDRKRYPVDWLRIAKSIKESADWKCQKCGKQCRRPGEPFDTHRNTLTVAHLNHTPEDVRPENLMAMCAPCHLKYDAKHHAETRKIRRMEQEKGGIKVKCRECTFMSGSEDGLYKCTNPDSMNYMDHTGFCCEDECDDGKYIALPEQEDEK